jgi:hypothetical protein
MPSIFSKILGSIFKSTSTQSQEVETPIQEVEEIVETPKEIEVVQEVVETEVVEVVETPQEPIQKPKKLSKDRFDKIQLLHEIITEKFKFVVIKSRKRQVSMESVDDIEKDVHALKAIENKISITVEDNTTLDLLFSKYNIK